MLLKELARRKGKHLAQLGVAGSYASSLNTGLFRAGPDAIAAIAAALDETPERIAEVLDQSRQDRETRRTAAAAPPTSPPASQPALQEV